MRVSLLLKIFLISLLFTGCPCEIDVQEQETAPMTNGPANGLNGEENNNEQKSENVNGES